MAIHSSILPENPMDRGTWNATVHMAAIRQNWVTELTHIHKGKGVTIQSCCTTSDGIKEMPFNWIKGLLERFKEIRRLLCSIHAHFYRLGCEYSGASQAELVNECFCNILLHWSFLDLYSPSSSHIWENPTTFIKHLYSCNTHHFHHLASLEKRAWGTN